ncbi:tellurite resistance TerB family protein [Aliikangiella marina]|uniref:Tellurite resistance TerB family protein n=1 Tax=Aliikangiella marina TaxID=1712262 RepID=A0A545THW8_9GAMM|nr:tellurite resistance TerB family protein [Aliikangiella marina]TQV76795.1 tellurite resistance TerB family protein [Aliikangiella marina]
MSIKNLFNQFVGSQMSESSKQSIQQGISRFIGGQASGQNPPKVKSNTTGLVGGLTGGIAGGVAAGGIMSLLIANKSARKFAGTAATYGGAAVLGGVAYKMYKNWQYGNTAVGNQASSDLSEAPVEDAMTEDYQLTLIKAMIAAAKADGHIDEEEQKKIFDAVNQMELSPEEKGMLFDMISLPISVNEIASGVTSQAQRAEVYFASCMVVNPDLPAERVYLNSLALALKLPPEFAAQLEKNAHSDIIDAA